MLYLRNRILRHSRFAAVILAVALIYRILVPVGFMPDASAGHIQISICTGYGPMTMSMDVPMSHSGKSDTDHHGKTMMACPFAGLSSPGLAGGGEFLLVAVFVFMIAIGLKSSQPVRIESADQLRPPLRGPPPTI